MNETVSTRNKKELIRDRETRDRKRWRERERMKSKSSNEREGKMEEIRV